MLPLEEESCAFCQQSQSRSEPMNNSPRKCRDQRWLMRWLILCVYLFTLLVLLTAGTVFAYQTRNPILLDILAPLLLAMRPIIRSLFK